MEYVINIQLIEKWYRELKIYKSDILERITYLPLIEAYQIMYMFEIAIIFMYDFWYENSIAVVVTWKQRCRVFIDF